MFRDSIMFLQDTKIPVILTPDTSYTSNPYTGLGDRFVTISLNKDSTSRSKVIVLTLDKKLVSFYNFPYEYY